ncbi:hypothetical protein KFK09_023489 [Dendrobium nobile]|uniref:Peptidase A1 domain-containing protein n=1 Tax=Dendrobium nobile TaxID=94219 RepID=A0A8T3ABB8_DENNO|nr:hypothetical protein KFK09_023489 [Dendrobium nobile]
MAMAMLTCLLLIHLITLFNRSRGLDFDYLNVHELLSSTHRRPPKISTHHLPNPAAVCNLSLQLHHRDSIFPNHLHSISDLFRRDFQRVAALHRRLVSPHYQLTDFTSNVFSGLDQGTGEYLVRLGVGTPPVEQYLVVDSGSDVIWLQCQPCSQCYTQSDPVFDPARSTSFSPIPYSSPICALLSGGGGGGGAADDGKCHYQVAYGDGSYTRGTLALETLTFEAIAVGEVAIGCGRQNGGLFVGAAGLLGLGWGPLSFVSQLGGLAGGSFAYCLPSSGSEAGEMVFGRSEAVQVGAVWVPLLRNPRAPSFYYVGLTGLGVGGARLTAVGEDEFELTEKGGGGTVVDTGTAVTRLPAAAYQALREGFNAASRLPAAAGVSIFDTCYALGGYGSVRVPTVSFYFAGGTELTLPARNLLIPVDGAGTFCLAFAASPSDLTILGNIQQQGIRITVDSANGFLGFGPNTC